MKAYILEKYGTHNNLKLVDIEKPIPNDDQVLVKVKSVSINKADLIIMKGKPFLVRFMIGGILTPPKNFIPVADVSGIIEQCGKNVKEFNIGDEIFVDLSGDKFGALAEYVLIHHKFLAKKPKNITFEQAAATPLACVTALNAFKKLDNITNDTKILINGVSGGVGTFVLQIAKNYSNNITAICSNRKIDFVKKMNVKKIIDYTKENFYDSEEKYDLIIAANGDVSIFNYYKALKPNGKYIMIGGSNKQIMQAMSIGKILSLFSNKKVKTIFSNPNKADLTQIKEMIESEKIIPEVSKVYAFNNVIDAFKYFESGESTGKVVINVN